MLLLVICGILILIIFGIFFSIFNKNNQQIEYFKKDKQVPVSKIIENTKNEINNNKDSWIIYNASKDKTKYLLKKNKEKGIIYSADITNENGKKIYTIYDKENKYIGTNGIQDNNDVISITGRFNTTVVDIKFTNSEKRIIINIGNNETIITGYGSFAIDNPYPSPWSKVIPIIYKEGGTVIAIMDYAEDIKNVKETAKNLPMEIIVSTINEKYMPLFFETFVLLQEYISNIQ
jgi:hypothetical protein